MGITGNGCASHAWKGDVEAFIEHEQDRGNKDHHHQDKTYGSSCVSLLSGRRRDCFAGCLWQKDTVVVT